MLKSAPRPLAVACVLLLLSGCGATTPPRPETPSGTLAPPRVAPSEPRRDAPKPSGNDIASFTTWTQKAQRAYNLLLGAVSEYQLVDQVSSEIMRGELGAEDAMGRVQTHTQRVRAQFKLYERAAARLAMPQVGSYRLKTEMRQTLAYLNTLREQVKQGFVQSLQFFDIALKGEKVSSARFAAKRLEHYIAILEAENALMRSSSLLSNANHPQRQLQKTAIASNLAIVALLRGYLDKIESSDTPPAIFIQEGNTHLGSARGAIERGRTLTRLILIRLRKAGSDRKLDQRVRQTLVETMLTYHESFKVEERIVGVIGSSLASLETGEEPTVLDYIEPLVDRRLALQRQRSRLISSVAGDLQ